MKRTNRYPLGQMQSLPSSTTYRRRESKRGPVVDARWQHPLQIGAINNKPNVHAMTNPHGIPVDARAKIAYAMNALERIKAKTEPVEVDPISIDWHDEEGVAAMMGDRKYKEDREDD